MKVNRILIEFHAPTRLVSIAFIGILSLLPLKLLSARVALGVHGPLRASIAHHLLQSKECATENIGAMEKYTALAKIAPNTCNGPREQGRHRRRVCIS
jgi:hypothetical protein